MTLDPITFDVGRPHKIEALLDQMTLEEQVALLAGADHWCTVPVARLNIPSLKLTDGPAGARGAGTLVKSKRTAAFPAGISLGSSWDPDLLHAVGVHLARETRDKGAGVLLGPTLNLFRSSLNGRNFENYSEDPHLTGSLGVAYVRGLQSAGVAATVKHFVGNESEFERGSISSDIPVRALRELYLRPFEMAVRDAGVWAVMTAYNRVNGVFSSEHTQLISKILRREWGFDGLVMSDWGGTHSAGKSVQAGLDLEMPGPATARADLLTEAREEQEIRTAVRAAAGNVLHLIERTGTFELPRNVGEEAEQETEYPDTRALIRRAGAEGTVLLKNEGNLLPLPAGVTVAVIGPNSAAAQVMGGGSAQMNAHRRVSPLEGLQAGLGAERVTWAHGTGNDRFLPLLQVPVRIEYFERYGTSPVATEEHLGSEMMWFVLPADIAPQLFHARLHLTLDVLDGGQYDVSLCSAGLSRLLIDNVTVINNWTTWTPGDTYFGFGSDEIRTTIFLAAGSHPVTIEYKTQVHDNGIAAFSAVRMGYRAPQTSTAFRDAVNLAAASDYAVVCIGTSGEWETEGVDRPGLALPGNQDALVKAVAAVNPRTVVCLQTGGPVLMPWIDAVPAVLQGWFAGQEGGHALADVLLGHADPGGRLPQTFPARLADDPTHPERPDVQYPGVGGHVEYHEGLYIGYRHVDRYHLKPLFPFGHGLSFTTFSIGEVRCSAVELKPGENLTVTVRVTNTGPRTGSTVIQLYVHCEAPQVDRPYKELKAFKKVFLNSGASMDAELTLDMRSFAVYDERQRAWTADAGTFHLLLGQSSVDLSHQASVRLTEKWIEAVDGS